MYFVRLSEYTVIPSLNSIIGVVFKMEIQRVFYEVGTEYLSTIYSNVSQSEGSRADLWWVAKFFLNVFLII
jgi:hypothetical protein